MFHQNAKLSIFIRSLVVSLFVVTLASVSTAQIEDPEPLDPNAAPPPVKAMSREERSQLDSKTDIKDRTKLALDLMSARLTKAETFGSKSEFAEMYVELGGFHALMDNAVDTLVRNSRDNLSTVKRFEIALRAFGPRLGLIRRDLPPEYDPYVRLLVKYLRDARTKTIEPLFGDTVVPNRRT